MAKKVSSVRRIVDRQYLGELHATVDLAFALAEEAFDSVDELSKEARLGVGTLYNLRSHRTRLPQFYSIVKLCRAVGLDVKVERRTIKLSLHKKERRA